MKKLSFCFSNTELNIRPFNRSMFRNYYNSLLAFILHCLLDENECLRRDRCRSNQICVNTVGSYRCDCNAGYQNVGGSCVGLCLLLLSYYL